MGEWEVKVRRVTRWVSRDGDVWERKREAEERERQIKHPRCRWPRSDLEKLIVGMNEKWVVTDRLISNIFDETNFFIRKAKWND